jgi:tetratricopeptide (TPR) repeat protein
VKRQQLLLVSIALVLFAGLFFFGKTVSPDKKSSTPKAAASADGHDHSVVTIADILTHAKAELSKPLQDQLQKLEARAGAEPNPQEKMHLFHQLARLWRDSARQSLIETYYLGEAAKLENSEKSLTFAAHKLVTDYLLAEGEPAAQHWLATQAKDLFEQALKLNPDNDSSKIGLGACYILGNISDNPMQGILPVKAIADKNPGNIYAQMVLGMGGMRSGQYDKAIERFTVIVQQYPDNLEAMFHLAECYELKGDKAGAIKWYQIIREGIDNKEMQKVLEERIKQLKA